ncbi:MAG: hypothetical protein ACM3NQ_03910, partial [Bacteroidales bacterium]
GGLLVSTVLSLVFVPSFFTVMDDIGNVLWRVFGRFVGPTDEPSSATLATIAGERAGHDRHPIAAE